MFCGAALVVEPRQNGTNPPSEVSREPWKPIFNELLHESRKGRFCVTHRLSTSAPPRSHPNSHPSGRCLHVINLVVNLEMEIRVDRAAAAAALNHE